MGGSDRSRFLLVVLLVMVLIACGEGAANRNSLTRSRVKGPSSWSATKTVPDLDRAVARLRDKVDLPILLPDRIPRGTRLDPRKPLRFYRSGDQRRGVLHLVFG